VQLISLLLFQLLLPHQLVLELLIFLLVQLVVELFTAGEHAAALQLVGAAAF